MTAEQNNLWTEKLAALEARVTELKQDAAREFQTVVRNHPLVDCLAAVESLTWATRDAIGRLPIEL